MIGGGRFIHIRGVSKVFAEGQAKRTVLREIDLTIEKGEYVSISGPSGSGKSTLLSIMGLLEVQSAGRYLLAGEDVSQLRLAARARVRNQQIGFIFQSFNLISDLSVARNIELPLTYRPGMSSRETKLRVGAMLERFDLKDREHDLPTELSGGEQQRVAVARALAGSPSLILADEPTGNLDSVSSTQVTELFSELNREGATLCLVTHDTHLAAEADRRLTIFDGQLALRQA